METLELPKEVMTGIAAKFKLEEVEEQIEKSPEELAAEDLAETIKAEAEALRIANEAAGNETGKEGKEEKSDDNAGGNEPKTPIASLIKSYGYKEEDFTDIDVADDTVEGIKKFYDKRDETVKTQAVNEFLSGDDDLKDLVKHKLAGGSVDTWREKKQAESFRLDFEEKDIEGKTNFLANVYINRGIPEKRAKLLIEGIKDDGELDEEVVKEATAIKAYMTKNAQAKEIAEREENENYQKEVAETVKQVTSIIKAGTLDNIIIPDTERKVFNEFVLSDSLTQKHEKLTLQQRLFIDYLVFKDFKVKGLEKVAAKVIPTGQKIRLGVSGGGDGVVPSGEISWEELKKLSKR